MWQSPGGAYGPFLLRENPLGPTLPAQLRLNPQWSLYVSTLFIESPVGVGYGYSDAESDYAAVAGDDATSADSYALLVAFYKLFPEHRPNPLYLHGLSYGGHFIPQLAERIVAGGGDLAGLSVGNPATEIGYSDYFYGVYGTLAGRSLLSEHKDEWEQSSLPSFAPPLDPAQREGVDVLCRLAERPQARLDRVLLVTTRLVVIYAAYAKARRHLLVLPRERIDGPEQLQPRHAPLLQEMARLAEWVDRKMRARETGLPPLRAGFHPVPSMKQLHLHLISLDFDSSTLLNKNHWNKFNTSFFVPPLQWAELLERGRSLSIDRDVELRKLQLDMRCPLTLRHLSDMDAVKAHLMSDEYRRTLCALSQNADPAPPLPPDPPGPLDKVLRVRPELQQLRQLGGTGDNRLVRHTQTKEQFVLKARPSEEHCENEVHAARIYRALGANVPQTTALPLCETAGVPCVMQQQLEGTVELRDLYDKNDTAAIDRVHTAIRAHFVVDCLLANWDVVGQAGGDNILVADGGRGEPWRIDNECTMSWRKGGRKSALQWGEHKGTFELFTFRDCAWNPSVARVFRGVDDGDVARQIAAVAAKRREGGEFDQADRHVVDARLRLMEQWTARRSRSAPAVLPGLELEFEKAEKRCGRQPRDDGQCFECEKTIPEAEREWETGFCNADYIIQLAAEGRAMPRRQDLPDAALFPVHGNVLVVSYPWLSRYHPDPDGHHVRALRDGGGWGGQPLEPGRMVFVDWMSLPQ
eukprot:gene22383-63886_t